MTDATDSRVSLRLLASTMSTPDTSAPIPVAGTVFTTAPAAAIPATLPAILQRQPSTDGDDQSSQSHPQSTDDSQDTAATVSTDQAFTPPGSDSGTCPLGPSSQDSQLLQLSQIAAAQGKLMTDGGSRKRMADGEVKTRSESRSPVKRHSRNHSAIGKASPSGGYLGELSAELRTRLSYAMVKVNNGWQDNSLEEVESLASKAASPSSSTSTIHHRQGSSASPRLAVNSTPGASAPSSYEPVTRRRKSNSPPRITSGKPALAPPAPIQPSMHMHAPPRSNPRRNSNPHYTPTLLSHSHSASPHTPSQRTLTGGLESRGMMDPILFSPQTKVREQDAAESLLFMSSPGNSANLKHAFSPTGSPGPHIRATRTSIRHALPSGPRKPLPVSQRSQYPSKRPGFERSPGMPPPPGSPMELDSPRQPYQTPNRGTPRMRINGSSHQRGALSLPSGLGLVNRPPRKILRDEDIDRMLDRAGAELADSSDDEEIQLPRRSGVAGIMHA
ncbi:hypothetical protein BGZ63DRAFT_365606 [Mariannaea sp. PMI_226]|nr:hypothetical protein BGZ63DRAFT_365606 [Mariannaea sp. PMI_226]